MTEIYEHGETKTPQNFNHGVCMLCGGEHDKSEDDSTENEWWGFCKKCDCWTSHPKP